MPRYEQSYAFGFEAAHELAVNVGPDHDYAHVHGHSFRVTVTLAASEAGPEGWVMDFAALREACEGVRARLDHRLLNLIEGLERPTLERLAAWIAGELSGALPALAMVEVARPSLSESVRYLV